MTNNISVGQAGEATACEYLRHRGFRILDTNWHCRYGEVDIVAQHGSDIVFVEVKTRRMLDTGHPLEALNPHKLRRMRQVAFEWRQAHPQVAGTTRIDAIGIYAPIGREPRIQHVDNLLI